MTSPRPIATAAPLDERDVARGVQRLDCRHRLACLNRAHAARWPGFACVACEVDDAITSREQLEAIVSRRRT